MGPGHSHVLLFKFALLYFLSAQSSDYANCYQGLWDCSADEPDELSFQRGDLIYIISKVGVNIGSYLNVSQDGRGDHCHGSHFLIPLSTC